MESRSITLTPNQVALLNYACARAIKDDRPVNLSAVDSILRGHTTDQLNQALKVYDDFIPIISMEMLRASFRPLIQTWGLNYPLEVLLKASKAGLKTWMKAAEIPPGQGFERPEMRDEDGAVKQWHRVESREGDLIHGKVPAQARGGAGEIELVEAEALVRPLIPDARFIEYGYGTPFYSPEEYRRMMRDDQNFSRRYEENRQKIQDYLRGVEIHVIYSNDNPLDSVAVEGPVIFVEDRTAEVYRSQIIENPTWLEVCRLANRMMETTGDLHHNFLEDIYREDLEIDGIPVYRFSTGS